MTLPLPLRIEGESREAFAAFQQYVADGEKHSIRRFVRRLHKAATTVARSSKRYRWQRRIAGLQNEQAIAESSDVREQTWKQSERSQCESRNNGSRLSKRKSQRRQNSWRKRIKFWSNLLANCDRTQRLRCFSPRTISGVLCSDLQQPTAQSVVNLVMYRDGQSDRVAGTYFDFCRQHPEHPQSGRFCSRLAVLRRTVWR